MFIAALLTIAKPGKQSKCPSTDEWIFKNIDNVVIILQFKKNVAYTYNGILLSLKKDGNPPICHIRDGSAGHHVK